MTGNLRRFPVRAANSKRYRASKLIIDACLLDDLPYIQGVSKSKPIQQRPHELQLGPPLITLLLLAFSILLVKNAWLSDDAYITFRSVDNFLAGNGLVYNVGERVQSYTHPLWLLILIPLKALFGELYYSTIVVSILLSLATVFIVIKQTTGRWIAVLAVFALATSKAFVDFTTSGLENPLTFALVAGFVAYAVRASKNHGNFTVACLIASLAGLCRLDTLLITLPLLAYCAWQLRGVRLIGAVCLGFSPLIVWTLFSLIYYGAPVANTVYAKLNTGISPTVMIAQGASFFADSLRRDQTTSITILAGLGLGFTNRSKASLWLSIGVVLYLIYIVYIGGDFMSGRFLTTPLLVAVVLITQRAAKWSTIKPAAACAALLLLSVPSAQANLLSGPRFGDVPLVPTEQFGPLPLSLINKDGICDERAFYYQATGLLRPNASSLPSHQWARWGVEKQSGDGEVIVGYAIGMLGYYAGPRVHVIDQNALNDFFLARLPVPRKQIPRIGHFERNLPQGYYESVVAGDNLIASSELAKFYDAVKQVIQSPLFSDGRLTAIWKMNTGGYDHLVRSYEEKTR